MNAEKLLEIIGSDFYTGVPDSQLKALCDLLYVRYGTDPHHHIVAANEGNCAAIAAGYHLATGKVPVVYMQNSGIGNAVNPLASLLNDKVYAIPAVFIVGWRGEPGVHDEPQHVYQGEITVKLLEDMDVSTFIIGKETSEKEVENAMKDFRKLLEKGKDVAFVIKKGGLTSEVKACYKNGNTLLREKAIEHIAKHSGSDPVISTTGKASRELFEIRERNKQSHSTDFLTVGSMGHASSIALGVALSKPDERIWCIDGDGALLMHLGAAAVIGKYRPANLIHIVINNSAHETVGGMPTAASAVDLVGIAKCCGYEYAGSVSDEEELDKALEELKNRTGLRFLEIKCSLGARADLGRPTTTSLENRINFMERLSRQAARI